MLSLRRRLAILGVTAAIVALALAVGWHTVTPEAFLLLALGGALAIYISQPLATAWERGREQRRLAPTPAGAERLIGEGAVVVEAIDPVGKVKVHGEIWRARTAAGEPIPRSEAVTVVGCEGLELTVEQRTDGP
jgi:membrane protein implicated in regulation of membrane protease activity